MSEKPIPKAQHLAPRLHLQHFAGNEPKGQVWTYDKDAGRMRSAIPEETATFTHFYSVELDDGTYDVTVEEALSQNETLAAPIYEGLLAGRFPDTDQKRADFSFFLAYLYLRTRAQRQTTANLIGRFAQIHQYAYAVHDNAFNTLTRKVEAERGEVMAPELKAKVRAHMLDPSGFEMHIAKEGTLMAFSPSEKLAQILFSMNWSLLTPEHGFFITSDNPLTRLVDPKTVSSIYGDGGFKNKTAQVSVALSPKLMLILSYKDNIPGHAKLSREGVDMWNYWRTYFSEQYVYAHLKHSKILKLAMELKGSRPVATTEGFGPKNFAKVVVPRRWKK